MNILDFQKFKYGIEHEFPCVRGGKFVDFSTATFDELNRVIEILPTHESDYPNLRVGDLGIKKKRWYIEGFERFDPAGNYLETHIKGFEIRTPICSSIDHVVETIESDFSLWKKTAAHFGFEPTCVSFNPFAVEFVPNPSLNPFELTFRHSPEERSAFMHMLTYGPDISFSHPDFSQEKNIDIARKLTYYSPFIAPFSFSSPFREGELWGGFSYRTFYRTGARPACMVFLKDKKDLLETDPTLTDLARIPAEVGRIEFKAFDTISNFKLYGALVAFLVGIALDETLEGRAEIPDKDLHQLSAREAFANEFICEQTEILLEKASAALPESIRSKLAPLYQMLASKRSLAHDMIDAYLEGKDIIKIITSPYEKEQ